MLVVIPLFHSFWEFGRDVSLNPLEIAKAFNAEILQDQGSNRTMKHMTRQFGKKMVKYGEILDSGDSGIVESKPHLKRLGIADRSRVIEPRFQVVYY